MDKFFTIAKLKKLLPANRDLTPLFETLSEMLPKYDVTTPERVSMFLGQCAHESYQFNAMTENLNYSVEGLRKVFPGFFTLAQARQYARQPERIANRVYANRLGNGDEKSGDGWKYRGHGFIQITGKYNHQKFAEYKNISLEKVLVYVKTLEGALEASLWFWTTRKLNDAADRLDIIGTTRAINGGLNGLEDRKLWVRKALAIFTDEEHEAPSILKKGDKGVAVFEMQTKLSKLGYTVSPDGFFGNGTENAIKQLQRDSGLPQDGIVGPKTRMLL